MDRRPARAYGRRVRGTARRTRPSRMSAACALDAEQAVAAYLWCWCENQAMAALKTVPLGQSAGQRMLATLGARLTAIARHAAGAPESEWRNFAPGFALACSRHATQYSRLFRS